MADQHAVPPGWFRSAVIGAAAGLAATLVKSASEPRLQSLAEARFPATREQKDLVGADPSEHPENMPPAAAIRRTGVKVTGSEPPEKVVSIGSQAIHLSFGTGFGVLYSVAVSIIPALGRGGGAPAGAALYAATHASTLPAIGLQPPPTSMPRAAVIWEAGSHLVYGATLELTRRVLTRLS